MAKPAIKLKKCAICKKEFQLFRSLQKCCSHQCALKLAVSIREKDERKAYKVAKLAIKTRGAWAKEAQAAFNKFIRARDHDRGCICCNNRKYDGQYHAGHFLSVGAYPELRFSLINCHKQKSSCNNYKSGNQVNYRRYLIGVIGEENVEWLEGPHEAKKYTIDELKEIKTGFAQWSRELEKELE